MNKEKKQMYITAAFIVVMMVASVLTVIPTVQAAPDDYFVYLNWNPGVGYTTGVNGYVDTTGYLGDPGAEYIFFTGGPSYCGYHTAYVYRVDTAGDPNMHPDNPDATGPIAPRTFTLVSTHYMGYYCSGHDNAFYVDDTGIYYGAKWGGIYHWDFDWNPIGWEVSTAAPAGAQTLARNPNTGDWWVGLANRQLYKWDGPSWVYQFTHPNLAGSHHDGMEIISDSLFISDMTSDKIIQYRLDTSGNAIDPPNSPHGTFSYSAAPPVEGMGYGPNKHIWISGWSSYTIYEVGGGKLQIALEGIPDQTIFAGEAFETFDLDDYTVGTPPFSWTYSENVNLGVNIDADNVVTITYPVGWTGSEKITFTVTDSTGQSASDDATFTVCPVQVVLCPDEYRWGSGGWEWDPFPDTFVGRQEVHFVNNGTADAYNVTATVTCVPVNVVATDPDVTIGDILAGGSAWSSDTFELRVDMTNPQDPNKGICWDVEYDDAANVHHVIEDVAKYCGEECSAICP
jgi:hypothetical protein